MARYGKTAQKSVERAMRKRKRGTLRSGGSGKRVTSRKQAIAIGLSEARKKGGKVPSRSRSRSKEIEEIAPEPGPCSMELSRVCRFREWDITKTQVHSHL